MYTGYSSFWQCKVYAYMREGSLKRRRQTTLVGRNGYFSAFATDIFGSFKLKADIIIQ